jgi:hypothetical protein
LLPALEIPYVVTVVDPEMYAHILRPCVAESIPLAGYTECYPERQATFLLVISVPTSILMSLVVCPYGPSFRRRHSASTGHGVSHVKSFSR